MTQGSNRAPDPPSELKPETFGQWPAWARSLVRTISDNFNFITQNFQQINVPATLPNVLVSQLVGLTPTYKASGKGRLVYVTDAAVSAVVAYSDGTTWRRIDTNAIIS